MTPHDLHEAMRSLHLDAEVDSDGELKLSLVYEGEVMDSTWVSTQDLQTMMGAAEYQRRRDE